MRPRRISNSSRLRPPEDGIVSSSRGGGWVSARWTEMLDALDKGHVNRLTRGRNFARNGRVRGLWFSPGLASAQVVADEYYNVSIRFRVFTDAEWKRVIGLLLDNLLHIASLLEGQLPLELVEQLQAAGIDLLPSWEEIGGDCNCDDYMLPCAHMAAVHTVLADALDGEPFLLFTLRGRPRAQLLAQLRTAWGDTEVRDPTSGETDPPDETAWFSAPQPLPRFDFRFKPAEKPATGLKALGPPPGDVDLGRALEPLYEKGAKAALETALADHDFEIPDSDRVRAFRRSVRRPAHLPTADGRPRRANLTDAIVDALAVLESAKSKELADRVGAPMLEVRQELLELEKLGIVYRTGQTRGTRWWLG